MNPFTTEASFPPSLAGMPFVAMLTVMAAMAITLLALQWVYSIIDDRIGMPAPRRSYIAIAREVRIWLMLAIFVMTWPRVAQMMFWQKLSAGQRDFVSAGAWVALIPAALMVAYAWWLDKRLTQTERTYVEENGFVLTQKSSRHEKTKGAIILLLVFVMAFGTAYIRPQPNVSSPAAVAPDSAG